MEIVNAKSSLPCGRKIICCEIQQVDHIVCALYPEHTSPLAEFFPLTHGRICNGEIPMAHQNYQKSSPQCVLQWESLCCATACQSNTTPNTPARFPITLTCALSHDEPGTEHIPTASVFQCIFSWHLGTRQHTKITKKSIFLRSRCEACQDLENAAIPMLQ